MVTALVSGSSEQGLSPGRGHCVAFLGKTLYSHSASFPVYRWVPANLMPGGSRNTPSRFMLQKLGLALA